MSLSYPILSLLHKPPRGIFLIPFSHTFSFHLWHIKIMNIQKISPWELAAAIRFCYFSYRSKNYFTEDWIYAGTMKRTRKILERSRRRIFCGQPGGTRRGAASEMAALPSEPQSSTPLQNFSAWMRKAPHGILLFWKPSDIRTSSQTRKSLPEYTNAAMNSTIRHPCFLYGRKNKK